MTKTAGHEGKGEEATAKGGESLYPLLMQSAAAFAAATAVGIGIQTQFARAMLGMFEGGAPKRKAADQPATEATPSAEPVAAQEVFNAPVGKPEGAIGANTARAPAPPKRKPAPARVKAAGDDLKRISGIGPKLEQVLNAKGIRRFAEIAAWSQKDVQRFDADLGLDGRIRRDDWIGQAKAMAAPVKKGK